MASKELEKKKILPSRGKRVDYKLLNDGFGDEDQESFWTEEHMEDIKLFSEETTQATLLPTSASAKNVSFHEDDEFSGDTDLNSKSRQTDSGIIQMKKELSALQQEERVLKEQLSEADVLRKQIEQKKQDVKKLRGEIVRGINLYSSKKPVIDDSSKNVDIEHVTLNDLRKNTDLRRKAKSKISKIGLDIFSHSDSDTCSDESLNKISKNMKKKVSNCLSSSEDSDVDTFHYSKNKIRSGILAKAGDKVVSRQQYPQSSLRFEYVTSSITFDKLEWNLFVAGELEIISSPSMQASERKARLELLKKLMYLCSSYDFVVVKNLYAAVLREIELGHLKWGDSYQYVESAILSSHVSNVNKKSMNVRHKTEKSRSDTSVTTERVWFCSQFQRNKCQQKAPHITVVKGIARLSQHICASCWIKDKVKLEHPECSSSCPYSTN
jgi:hypothetical protein